MPVVLFTFHAYRSWNADRPHVRRDRPGIQAPNPALARKRDAIAAHPPVTFTPEQQALLIDAAIDVCTRRAWRLHAASATATHVHLVVSWRDDAEIDAVSDTIKRLLGYTLSTTQQRRGSRWFSRGDLPKRVRDAEHLEHLLCVYLPKHVAEGGRVWRESR